jgi:hypothetical protein
MYYWCIRDENGHPGQMGAIDNLSRIPEGAEEITEEEFEMQKDSKGRKKKADGSFMFVKTEKLIQELSNECERKIISGIEYNGKQYSLSLADQININNMYQKVSSSANTLSADDSITYHANNEVESEIDMQTVLGLKQSMDNHVQSCRAHYNKLKHYLLSLGAEQKDYEVIKDFNWDTVID